MAQSLPDLPLELLLDILEWLLMLGGKANQRSAAYLAQSCRLLRNSEAGKRARYIHALAKLSNSVPSRLPTNIEYETQVLETASWPPPAAPRQSDAIRLDNVWTGVLDIDGYAVTSQDRKTMVFSTIELDSSSSSSSQPSLKERSVQHKTIQLGPQVYEFGSNRSGTRYAVLYLDAQTNKEKIEIWDMQSGVCQGAFELDEEADGLATGGTVVHMMMSELYLSILRDGFVQVRYIPLNITAESKFDVVFSLSAVNANGWYSPGASLLAPNFLAVIAYPTRGNPAPYCVRVEFYRLEPNTSKLVATVSLPDPSEGLVSHVSCGADVVPGEEGLAVLSVRGTIYLLSISTLVGILYSPSDAAAPRSFGEEWVKNNMKKLKLFTKREHFNWASVSGWRCVFSLAEIRGCDKKGRVLLFLDASPKCCKAHGQRSHLSSSCTPRLYERKLAKYLPESSHEESEIGVSAQLKGGRLQVHNVEAEAILIWRL